MILIDYYGVAIPVVLTAEEITEDILRHRVLMTIMSYRKKYKGKFGEIIIAKDGRKNWRKDYFPYYKGNRKLDPKDKTAEEIQADRDKWYKIITILNKITDEIQENFPWKVIYSEKGEADDVIAVLAKRAQEPVLIVSTDKDFFQLHKLPNVKQVSPRTGEFIVVEDLATTLRNHILCGDSGDGVPNFLSDDDSFVNENSAPRPRMTAKIKNQYGSDLYSENAHPGIIRNRTLVDFDYIPLEVQNDIIEKFDSYQLPKMIQMKIMTYLSKHRAKVLIDNISNLVG